MLFNFGYVTNFDDTVGNFDSVQGDFELGGTDTTSNPNFNNSNRDAKGFYNFTNSLSLTQVYDGNIEPTITLDAENPYDLFDSGRGALFFDSTKHHLMAQNSFMLFIEYKLPLLNIFE